MKNKILLVGTLLLTQNALAINVDRCPPSIRFTITNTLAKTEEQIRNDETNYLDEEEMVEVLQVREDLAYEYNRQAGDMYLLPIRETGVCRYAGYGQDKAKFFTRGGKNYLRIGVRAQTRNLGFYIKVADDGYGVDGITPLLVDPETNREVFTSIVFEQPHGNGEFSSVLNMGFVNNKNVELELAPIE